MIEQKAKDLMLSKPYVMFDSLLMDYFRGNSCAIAREQNGKQILYGSGTFVKFKGRIIVATAAHVIKKWKPEEIFIGTPSCEFFPVERMGFEGGGEFDRIDVAWLVPKLGKSEKRILDSAFDYEKIEEDYEIDSESPAYLTGFPYQYYDPQKRHAAFMIYRTVFPPNPKYVDITDKEHHIVLAYPQESLDQKLEPMEMPVANGFSGGGIWKMKKNKANILTTSEIHLVGIDTSWAERSRLVIGNKSKYWKAIVQREFENSP